MVLRPVLGGLGATLGGSWAVLGRSWGDIFSSPTSERFSIIFLIDFGRQKGAKREAFWEPRWVKNRLSFGHVFGPNLFDFGSQMPPFGHPFRDQYCSKDQPKIGLLKMSPQDRPKTAQDPTKSAPRPPKPTPRPPQDPPRAPQETRKALQNAPDTAQETEKSSQEAVRSL